MAASPTTPPHLLLSLAKTGDAQITALLAANPNTPRKTLHKLWLSHPLCALENPILLYWSLREGKPTNSLLPVEVKMALYLELRESGDAQTLEYHLPANERRRWLGRPLQETPNDPNAPDTSRRGPRRRANHDACFPYGLPFKEGVNGGFKSLYKALATDPSGDVRSDLAEQIDSIPFAHSERAEIQSILALDASASVRRHIAATRHLGSNLHIRLSRDPVFEVRSALASNPYILANGNLEGWKQLMAGGHAEQIALNPACPEALKLELIAEGSPDEKLRAWASFRFHETANWPAVNLAIKQVLADQNRLSELVEIARNQTLGGTLKGSLLHHPEARVTRALATQIHLTEQQRLSLLFHPDHKTALRAAKHAPPADFLDCAAVHPSPWVRALLARKTGEKTWSLRAKLVRDPDPRVRIALCRGLPETAPYHALGAGIIEIVKKTYPTDPSPRVRLAAKKSPHCAWKRSPNRWLP
jgi:hypothetical protein